MLNYSKAFKCNMQRMKRRIFKKIKRKDLDDNDDDDEDEEDETLLK